MNIDNLYLKCFLDNAKISFDVKYQTGSLDAIQPAPSPAMINLGLLLLLTFGKYFNVNSI